MLPPPRSAATEPLFLRTALNSAPSVLPTASVPRQTYGVTLAILLLCLASFIVSGVSLLVAVGAARTVEERPKHTPEPTPQAPKYIGSKPP